MDTEQVAVIATNRIRDPKVLLRPVRCGTLEYVAFYDSVRLTGLWNSIAVRPVGDGWYEVIDGFYRLVICRQLGRESMPCIVREATDAEVMAAQIRANAVRPTTRPVEFAQQLRRIQDAIPGIELPQLAVMVSRPPQWVRFQLGLLKLVPEAAERVDRGDISLQSAYMLAKVPEHKQRGLIEEAVHLSSKDFCGLAANVIKQWMEAVKNGRMAAFYDRKAAAAQPYMRSLKDTVEELRTRRSAAGVLACEEALTLTDAFYVGLRWACHLDKESVATLHGRAEARATKHLERVNNLKTLKKGASP